MTDLSSRIDLLKDAIATEMSAIRAQKFMAGGVLCVGMISAVFVHILAGNALGEQSKWILSICGPCISTGGAGFPLKEIYCRRYKIHRLRFLKAEYEKCQQHQSAADPVPLSEMKEFLEFIEKCGG
jgi:hypothetical protein